MNLNPFTSKYDEDDLIESLNNTMNKKTKKSRTKSSSKSKTVNDALKKCFDENETVVASMYSVFRNFLVREMKNVSEFSFIPHTVFDRMTIGGSTFLIIDFKDHLKSVFKTIREIHGKMRSEPSKWSPQEVEFIKQIYKYIDQHEDLKEMFDEYVNQFQKTYDQYYEQKSQIPIFESVFSPPENKRLLKSDRTLNESTYFSKYSSDMVSKFRQESENSKNNVLKHFEILEDRNLKVIQYLIHMRNLYKEIIRHMSNQKNLSDEDFLPELNPFEEEIITISKHIDEYIKIVYGCDKYAASIGYDMEQLNQHLFVDSPQVLMDSIIMEVESQNKKNIECLRREQERCFNNSQQLEIQQMCAVYSNMQRRTEESTILLKKTFEEISVLLQKDHSNMNIEMFKNSDENCNSGFNVNKLREIDEKINYFVKETLSTHIVNALFMILSAWDNFVDNMDYFHSSMDFIIHSEKIEEIIQNRPKPVSQRPITYMIEKFNPKNLLFNKKHNPFVKGDNLFEKDDLEKYDTMSWLKSYSIESIIDSMFSMAETKMPQKTVMKYFNKVENEMNKIFNVTKDHLEVVIHALNDTMYKLSKFKQNNIAKKYLAILKNEFSKNFDIELEQIEKVNMGTIFQRTSLLKSNIGMEMTQIRKEFKNLKFAQLNVDPNGLVSFIYTEDMLKESMEKLIPILKKTDNVFFNCVRMLKNVLDAIRPFQNLSQKIVKEVPPGIAKGLIADRITIRLSEKQIESYFYNPVCQSYFEDNSLKSLVVSIGNPLVNDGGKNTEKTMYEYVSVYVRALKSIQDKAERIFSKTQISPSTVSSVFSFPSNSDLLRVDPEYLFNSASKFERMLQDNFQESKNTFLNSLSKFESWKDVSVYENCTSKKMVEFISVHGEINQVTDEMLLALMDIVNLNKTLDMTNLLIQNGSGDNEIIKLLNSVL